MFRKIFFILILFIPILISISFSDDLQFNGSIDMRFNYSIRHRSPNLWNLISTRFYLNRVELDIKKSLEYKDRKIDIFVQLLPDTGNLGDAYFIVRNAKSKNGIKYGRFDIPFGLSTQVDVYNTLIHPDNKQNIGIQKDDGIEVFGENKFFGYNFSLTDSNDYYDYYYKLLTLRINKHFKNNMKIGLSNATEVLFAKKVSHYPNINKNTRGLDLIYRCKIFTLKGEAVTSYNKIYDKRTNVYYSELDYNINKKSEFIIGYNLQRTRQMEYENACRGECKFRGLYETSKQEIFFLGYDYKYSENYITRTAIDFSESGNTKVLSFTAQTYLKF